MPTTASLDREAAFATMQPLVATPQADPQRTWHMLTTPTVAFASEDAMRFGPRSYTPRQRLVIDRAVANRTELSAPRLRRD
jgi:hypothetical protein